jgi:hypothetical protein
VQRPGLVEIEDKVLNHQSAVWRKCLTGTALDIQILFLGKHMADRVEQDDVVA